MQLVFVSRMLEAFFRRWWLFLIPIVAFGALGVASVAQRTTQYWSVGVVRVSGQTILSDLTRVGASPTLGFETPADYAAREINAVLGTDQFISSVIERAGIVAAVESGVLDYDDVRDAVWASAGSDLLVEVNALTDNPELAQRLAAATIDSYLQWLIDDGVNDSSSAEAFFETLLASYQQRYDDAEKALQDYLTEHPGPTEIDRRPVAEQLDIGRLSDAVQRADSQLSSALQSLADARLATAQTETDVTLRMRTIDPPEVPDAPLARRVKDAMTMLMMLVLGTVVSLIGVALAALLDRSVRYPDEAERQFDLTVLAVLPNSSGRVSTSGL